MKKANKTKKTIIGFAERLFSNYGYQETTIRLITENAGVNVSAINHYYVSKQGLYQWIFVKRLSQLSRKLEALIRQSIGPEPVQIEALAIVLQKFGVQNPEFMALFFRELSILPYSVCKFTLLRFLRKSMLMCIPFVQHDRRIMGYRTEEKFYLLFQLLYSAHPALHHSTKMEKFLLIGSNNQFQTISQRMKYT